MKRWQQTNAIIKTDNEVNKLSVGTHTRNMIHMGERSINEFLPEDREISTMSLGISKQAAVEIKQKIQQFKDDILKFVEQDKSPSEEVYQFNTQFFPLVTKKPSR